MIKIWFVVILLAVTRDGMQTVVRYPSYNATIEAMALHFLTKESCQDGGEDVTKSVIKNVSREGKVTSAEWYCDYYEYRPALESTRIIHRNDYDKD